MKETNHPPLVSREGVPGSSPERHVPTRRVIRPPLARGAHGLQRGLLLFIAAYRYFLSPVLGSHCRFVPSCSAYMGEAISRYGVWKGVWLGAMRIGRCHPFNDGGYDPVP